MYANTLLAKKIDKKRARLVVPVRECSLVLLVLLDVLDVFVEKVRGIERSALGLRMELSAEDGTGVVDQTLVGLVIEVGEVLPPLTGQCGGIDSVSVVLRSDVALASGKVQGRDVVSTVAILQLDGLGTSGESNKLMTHAYAHDRDLGSLEQFAKIVHGGVAMSRVTWAVGDEDAIKVVGDLVNGIIKGEAGDTGTTRNKTAQDVLFHTAIDESNMHVAERRAHMERSLSGHTTNQVNGFGINVGLVFVGIVLLANGDASKGGTLLTEIGYDLTCVDTRNGWYTLTSAPFSQGLDSSPVTMLHGVILDNNTRGLDVGRLEVPE